MAQTLIVGVLIVGPLIYTQTLPFVTKLPDITVYRPPATPPPLEPITTTPTTTRATPRLFVPTTVPKGMPRATTIEADLVTTVPPDAILVGDAIPGIPVSPIPARISVPEPAPAKEAPVTIATAAPKPDLSKPLAISGGVLAAKLITQVVPKYPPLAVRTHTSGIVRLLGIIDRQGRVRNLRVLDGPALLRQSALEAVSQWVYAPTLLNGQPVEVEAPIEVHFQLN